MAWVGRKYKLDRQEKFDEYMKAIGIGMVMRKMANSSSPVITMVQNGDEYTFKSEAALKTTTMTFKLGQDFIDETADGRKLNSVMTLDGNVFTQEQKGDHPTTIIREFSETECVTTIKYNDIVSTRWYKVVN